MKLSYATADLMYKIFSEFAEVNQDLILESNFRIGELETLQKMAAERDYQMLILILRGDVEILHQRYLNRMHNENRPAVHLCEEFNTIEGFGAYLDSLRTETVPGDAIWIDANDFSYQTDGKIYEILDGFFQV